MTISNVKLRPYTRVTRGGAAKTSDGGKTYICVPTAPTTKHIVWNNASSPLGINESRDPKAPYKGDKIVALPYWNMVTEVSEPIGQFVRTRLVKNIDTNPVMLHRNVCKGAQTWNETEWTYPGGSIRLPAPRVLQLPTFSPDDEHFVRKVAETKAVNKLRRGVASIPMVWFERAATIENMRTRLDNLVDIAVNRQKSDLAGYRKIKGKNARKRFAKKVANDHLEMIFGWAPLLQDLEGLVEYINEPARDFVRANGKHSMIRTSTIKGEHIGKLNLPDYNYVQKTHESLGYRCALRADITSRLSNNFRQIGFQPVYTAYDAVPLSFVLGWFSNFGSWIGTFDPLYGVEFRTGSTNRRSQTVVITTAYGTDREADFSPGSFINDKTNGKMEQEHRVLRNDRTPLQHEPDREFFFMNNLSIYSVLAGLSLAVQRKLKIARPLFEKSPFQLKKGKRRPTRNLPPIQYRKT